MNKYSKTGGKELTRVSLSTWRKLSVPHWSPQIPQVLKWNWTRASVVRKRRPTVWYVTRPCAC